MTLRWMQSGSDEIAKTGWAETEHRIIRGDGEARWVQVRVGALFDPDGKVIKVYGVNQDISDRKMKEAPSKKEMVHC